MAAVASPRVVNVAAIGFRVPVVEGDVVGHRESHAGAALPIALAIEVHRGLALKLVGAAFGYDDGVEHALALQLGGCAVVEALYGRGEVAVGNRELSTVGHAGEGAAAIHVYGIREIHHTVADGDVDIRPSHHAGAVLAIELAFERAAVDREAARVHSTYQATMCGVIEYVAQGW